MIFYLKFRRHRSRLWLLCSIVILVIFYIFGVFTHLFEADFETEFAYPIHSTNFRYLVETAKSNLPNNELQQINNHTFRFSHNPSGKCEPENRTNHLQLPITLLIVVKSAACNHVLRTAIRQSWAFENRFSDINIRTVFILGQCSRRICSNKFSSYPQLPTLSARGRQFASQLREEASCQSGIDLEQSLFADLVQADFVDSYYNNTLKTMESLYWTYKHCSQVPFILFVDDDYYVSIKNLLHFTRHYLRAEDESEEVQPQFDGRLYSGFVFAHSRPMRHLPSKWYISLADYPYNRYPPYITGGCFLLNNRTLVDLYFASLYTKHFKYDDVYLGILAKKMEINLIPNNNHIHFDKLPYDRIVYRDVIGSHGYHNPVELLQVWNEQKSLGNA